MKRIVLLQNTSLFQNVHYPQQFTFVLPENASHLLLTFDSSDELVLYDSIVNPNIILHDTLHFEHAIAFDIRTLRELYIRYSSLETDEQCLTLQKNELFDLYSITCIPYEHYLQFTVETPELVLIKPLIRFRIEKSGSIEFTQK